MKLKNPVVYTIGHSTRKMKEFLNMLINYGVKELVDVRTIPRSRHNPQFNEAMLKYRLKKADITYKRIKELGGLRHSLKNSVNMGWKNKSFRGYADYMQTSDFESGLKNLQKIAVKKRTAIMCAEALPWRCHRSLIADALTKKKWDVFHIMSAKNFYKHKMTSFARVKKGKIIYPLAE
ncbi:MAG: DUF488 domain-containing protein [Patescibacteria group bacterium]|nr:DUF488 domain-containing protein [Patescibacteria group bacterium]